MARFSDFMSSMDSNVLSDVKKLSEEIKEEEKSMDSDKEKLLKLKLQRLNKAMEMGNLYGRSYTSMYPW